ncbi:hypothetical protein [Tenacibaculum sp. M341]|uniref:hypothetical protein n=1 Tax=Tenacibaculum sp. M341 TaxID=2530339 RepID=UPI00104E2099|nr:hypothetical protein [Tenacibaculum sp. M341]TCI85206.1 hypothetical protein EYW44_18010 [Tenacibaculum sp. M341]
MKTQILKVRAIALMTVAFGVFTSCEKNEETVIDETSVVEETVVTSKVQTKTSLVGVRRYFLGGANSIHTYRVSNIGAAIGRYEGMPFKLGIYNNRITPTPPSGTRKLYFLISPGNRDFLMTTNVTERNNVRRAGWKDVSEFNFVERDRLLLNESAYIHTSGGSGRVKLYRFYGSSNSDHLFTTNYQEGVNAGYAYEGTIGWVHR